MLKNARECVSAARWVGETGQRLGNAGWHICHRISGRLVRGVLIRPRELHLPSLTAHATVQ